jgi:hypothetical protein
VKVEGLPNAPFYLNFSTFEWFQVKVSGTNRLEPLEGPGARYPTNHDAVRPPVVEPGRAAQVKSVEAHVESTSSQRLKLTHHQLPANVACTLNFRRYDRLNLRRSLTLRSRKTCSDAILAAALDRTPRGVGVHHETHLSPM